MCGIAGYSTLGSDQTVPEGFIGPMVRSLHHRGPDDRGSIVFPRLAMGTSRLSIIDIEGGHQPIANADRSTWVVYNGELYNSPELRQELEGKGYEFRTRTDTEVLVHLYDEEGIGFLERLNGMFGLALYDRREERLLVARDRFGVKPLVYTYTNGMLSFASEIKALRLLPDFDSTLDPEGLSVFLGLFYIPDPWTIYKQVRKLRPGHYLLLDQHGLTDRQYHDIDLGEKIVVGREEAGHRTAVLLRQAIQRQLLSDVPVGVLLSGGLDSRSVLAGACERIPGSTSFTIGFEEDAYDEDGEARFWSRAYQSPHKTMVFTEADFCDDYLKRQRHLDEPYALWCNVATSAFARFIGSHDYKVVLSGEGGDELFLGYPTIHAANGSRYYRLLPESVRSAIRNATNALPAGSSRLPFTFKLKSFVNSDSADLFRTFFGYKEVVRFSQWPSLLTQEALSQIRHIDPYIAFEQYRDKVSSWNVIDAMSYLDFKVFLPGCSFVGNDNAFMSASIESRVPMMDNDLVDFATRLPVDVRFHPFKPKVLLRQALQKHFTPPASAGRARRYTKNGFEVPGNVWVKNPLFQGLLNSVLSPRRLEETGFFQPAAIRKIVEEQITGKQNHERLLQAVMSLTLFLDGTYQSHSP